MKVSDFFYTLVNSVTVKGDNNLFREFFDKSGGYLIGFLIATAVGIIVAAVYYFVCCNRSFSLAKVYVWFVVLILSACTSYYITSSYAKGSLTTILDRMDKKARSEVQLETSEEDREMKLAAAAQFKQMWEDEIKKSHAKITRYALMNACYAMLFFCLASFLFKNYTVYGKAIPLGRARGSR